MSHLRWHGGDHEIYAYEFQGARYDEGAPMGLLRASLEFALKREYTRQAAVELVKTLR